MLDSPWLDHLLVCSKIENSLADFAAVTDSMQIIDDVLLLQIGVHGTHHRNFVMTYHSHGNPDQILHNCYYDPPFVGIVYTPYSFAQSVLLSLLVS